MSNKLNNLFEKSECPDRQTLFSYVAGTLPPAREHLVEEHMIDCDFCSEAVEAYRQEKDLPMINEQLIELEEKIIRGETGRRGSGFFNSGNYLKYAAVLGIILLSMSGLYFLLSDNKNQDLVMEAPVSRQAPSVQKEDRKSPNSPEPARAVKLNGKKDRKGNPVSTNEIFSADSPTLGESEMDDQNLGVSPPLSSDMLKDNALKVKTETAAPIQKKPKVVNDEKLLSKSTEETVSDNQYSKISVQGAADSQASSAREASPELKEIASLQLGAGKNKSLLDSAIKAYDDRYYIRTINILLNFTGKDRKESAKAEYYLASAYVQTREYEKAKPILEKLKAEGSSYSRKARKLLESIE